MHQLPDYMDGFVWCSVAVLFVRLMAAGVEDKSGCSTRKKKMWLCSFTFAKFCGGVVEGWTALVESLLTVFQFVHVGLSLAVPIITTASR